MIYLFIIPLVALGLGLLAWGLGKNADRVEKTLSEDDDES